MARFAINCLHKLQSELLRLEKMLGPDTATLGMRIGLHSGAVTAGVLRGDRARFQVSPKTTFWRLYLTIDPLAHVILCTVLDSCLVTL